MAARLLSLGALVIVTAGCGAEAVPSDDGARETVRIESVTRYALSAASTPQEFRSTRTVDYGNDRTLYVDPTTGCRGITIGRATYSEVPSSEGMPEGKHWVGFGGEASDPETLFEQSAAEEWSTTNEDGVVVESSSSHIFFEAPDPGPDEYVDYLRERTDELELVGEEDIHGVSTTHYRAKLDVRARIRRDLEAEGWKPANVDRYLEQIGGDEVVDVWVGDDGLVRRVVTATTNESGAGGSFETVTRSDYLDYGLETEIEAPPAAEVLDQEEWDRIAEERMRTEMDDYEIEGEVGTDAFPGAFEPSAQPSCLH